MFGVWAHLRDDEKVCHDKHGGVRNEDEEAVIAAIDAKREMESQQTDH